MAGSLKALRGVIFLLAVAQAHAGQVGELHRPRLGWGYR